jgi:hypothetical protein
MSTPERRVANVWDEKNKTSEVLTAELIAGVG